MWEMEVWTRSAADGATESSSEWGGEGSIEDTSSEGLFGTVTGGHRTKAAKTGSRRQGPLLSHKNPQQPKAVAA